MEGSYGGEKVGGQFKARGTTMPVQELLNADFMARCSSLVHVGGMTVS